MIQIFIKRLTETAKIPTRATPGSAGYDLYAAAAATIEPGQWQAVSTGLAMELETDAEAQIRSRSGLALKHGVAVLNSPGTIDSDYRGEVKVVLINHGFKAFVINPGDRIAQMVVSRLEEVQIGLATDLIATSRGEGGFGSSGT